MEKRSYSKRILPSQHQKAKPKLSDGFNKPSKNYSKCSDAQRQIPKIIGELEKNIKLLKKFYEE